MFLVTAWGVPTKGSYCPLCQVRRCKADLGTSGTNRRVICTVPSKQPQKTGGPLWPGGFEHPLCPVDEEKERQKDMKKKRGINEKGENEGTERDTDISP